MLDGEIVCLNTAGEPQFNALLFRRALPWFYAFDLLFLDGEDLRSLPLLERKRRLRRLVPRGDSRLLYVDHVARRGCDLFRAACERDREGIVGKLAHSPYVEQPPPWMKVLNPLYTQKIDRRDLFERREDCTNGLQRHREFDSGGDFTRFRPALRLGAPFAISRSAFKSTSGSGNVAAEHRSGVDEWEAGRGKHGTRRPLKSSARST